MAARRVDELRPTYERGLLAGGVDADPEEYGARGKLTSTNLDLRTLLENSQLPKTQLSGQYDLDVRGSNLAKQ